MQDDGVSQFRHPGEGRDLLVVEAIGLNHTETPAFAGVTL
jgi:hypothetical protein